MPSDYEITRIRRLINRMNGDLDELSDEDRAQIKDAVAVVRRNRSKITSLGMPRIRQPLPDLRPERTDRQRPPSIWSASGRPARRSWVPYRVSHGRISPATARRTSRIPARRPCCCGTAR
jgi:hypothetical protein